MKLFISIFAFIFCVSQAQANLSVMPGFVSFGQVSINSVGMSHSVSVYNFGPEEVSLSFFDTCSFDFQITHYMCSMNLKANQSCSVQISFSPHSEGSQSCTVYINSFKGGSQSISVSGSGKAPLTY